MLEGLTVVRRKRACWLWLSLASLLLHHGLATALLLVEAIGFREIGCCQGASFKGVEIFGSRNAPFRLEGSL